MKRVRLEKPKSNGRITRSKVIPDTGDLSQESAFALYSMALALTNMAGPRNDVIHYIMRNTTIQEPYEAILKAAKELEA